MGHITVNDKISVKILKRERVGYEAIYT